MRNHPFEFELLVKRLIQFIAFIIRGTFMSQGHHREQQLGNFQKELLTNYFLQKYNTLMGQMTHTNQHQETFKSQPQQYRSSKKKNFKNVMMLRERNNNSNIKIETSGIKSRNSSRSRQKQQSWRVEQQSLRDSKHESRDDKNLNKLESSLIKELFKESPTKLEKGNYNKIQISPHRSSNKYKSPGRQDCYDIQNIEVTFEDQREEENSYQKLWRQEQAESRTIRQAIKLQFEQRKNPIYFSISRNSSKERERSLQQSSSISMEGVPSSPKKSKRVSPFGKIEQTSYHEQLEVNEFEQPKKESFHRHSNSIMRTSGYYNEHLNLHQQGQSPHVHFQNQNCTPVDVAASIQPSREEQEIAEKEIQFVAPSSSYYKSQNNNFIEEAFQHQAGNEEHFAPRSEGNKSLQQRQISQIMKKKQYQRNSGKSGKQSPPIETSFMSRLSYFSSEEGSNIKNAIQKELFDHELGPYQSALYNILDLIQSYPRSGSVYTVGQRTLDDRKKIEEKKMNTLAEAQSYRKKIQKLERRGTILHYGGEQEIIKRNKLDIMRLIRKLGVKLK